MKTLQEMTTDELTAELDTAKGLRQRSIRAELQFRQNHDPNAPTPLDSHEKWEAAQPPLSTVFTERERRQEIRELSRSSYMDDREIEAVVGPAGKIVDRMKKQP